MSGAGQVVGMDYQVQQDCDWMVDTSGVHSSAIKDYLVEDGIPEDGANKIIQNAAKVLRYCPNPQADKERDLTGIVIGKVQSGKTSNFISLTALAFDNGYSHVVVFGGTKKLLVSQNSERIKEYFANCPDVIVLNTVDHRKQLSGDTVLQFTKHRRKVIIVALKRPDNINLIKSQVFSNDELAEKPTLIIDDEGDEASLNTLVKKGRKSSTYQAIEELKSVLKRHCFVSVTATPQANLLISSMDILSPDFGILVDPGKGYCGLDTFHTPDSQYVRTIPDSENSLLDSDGVPASFDEALATFFVACGIFAFRGLRSGDHLSMLIHPSQKKIDHDAVFKKTKDVIDLWKNMSSDRHDIAYLPLRRKLVNAYEKYKVETIPDIPPFEEIEEGICEAINFNGLHKVNGDSVPNGLDANYDFNIYVGGTMLGRGLTLKGLAITYIIRTSKGTSMADTVTQRARWFGYKTRYLDLCRVYAARKIAKEFKDIREHEEDIWDTVRDANLQGTCFKDIARIFVLSDNLKPTRTNVAQTDGYKFKPWNLQRIFLRDEALSDSNKRILNQFREKHKGELQRKEFGGDRAAPYILAEGISFDVVKEELVDAFIFPQGSTFNRSIISRVFTLLKKKGISPTVDVIWMRDGITSKHKIDEDGSIGNYFVGRRPDDYGKPAVYKGDRDQFITPDRFQLQIHMIEDVSTGRVSPVLALYIPKQSIEKLTNLVIRR